MPTGRESTEGEVSLTVESCCSPAWTAHWPFQTSWKASLFIQTLGKGGLPGGWGLCKDFCHEPSPILQSCLPLLCFPGVLSWGRASGQCLGGQGSSLPLRSLGATVKQVTTIISLMSSVLSKLNRFLFHNNKVDVFQFLRNKSAFRNVLQEWKLDFAIEKNATGCPSLCPNFCTNFYLCL